MSVGKLPSRDQAIAESRAAVDPNSRIAALKKLQGLVLNDMPFLLTNQTPTRALVVEDALFCGACHPRPDPVELPELD